MMSKKDENSEEGKTDIDNGFDSGKFMSQCFTPREGSVEVKKSVLADFFPEGVDPVWKVRGLTADEIARSADAEASYKNIEAIVRALGTGNADKITEGIQNLLGTGTDVHSEVVKRMEHLKYGSVSPVVTQQMAVKIAKVAPVEFYAITARILELTGQGQIAGKSKPSGKEQTSKPASSSQT